MSVENTNLNMHPQTYGLEILQTWETNADGLSECMTSFGDAYDFCENLDLDETLITFEYIFHLKHCLIGKWSFQKLVFILTGYSEPRITTLSQHERLSLSP